MLVCYPLKMLVNILIFVCVWGFMFVLQTLKGFLLLEQVIEWNRKQKNWMDNDDVVQCYVVAIHDDSGGGGSGYNGDVAAVVCMYFLNKNLIIIFSFLPFQFQLFLHLFAYAAIVVVFLLLPTASSLIFLIGIFFYYIFFLLLLLSNFYYFVVVVIFFFFFSFSTLD